MSWIKITEELRATGSFEKTMDHLNQILINQPNDPEIYYQIAWTHDALGKETDAVFAYEKAISLGLAGNDLEGAYLGLGSTYRALGDYTNSKRIFEIGIREFPTNGAIKIFYAMTLYNLKMHHDSMKILITELVNTTNDKNIKSYGRALISYSQDLDVKFE